MTIPMPEDIAELRDNAVASKFGGDFSDEDGRRLFEWLFYKSDWLDFDHISCFVHLDHFLLSDADLRKRLDVSEDEPISDEARLDYAKCAIQKFNEDGNSVLGSTVVQLTDIHGREGYGCW